MSKMDDQHRYHPHHRTKNPNDKRYDEDLKRRYNNKNKKDHHQYSSSRRDERFDHRNYTDFSNQYQQSKYSYFPPKPPPPPPLMSTEIAPLPTLQPSAVPHERESWIRSVKKTKINESTEQKTQYLETMLRMPQQQKSSINSLTFDRIRFADDQISTTTTSNNNLDENSFQLIRDINNHQDICILENILFNNELQTTIDTSSNQTLLPASIIDSETSSKTVLGSGFLIDNCDEEVEVPPLSPPTCSSPPPSTTEESIQEDLNERRVMLVSELDAADAGQRQELKRQKRLQKKLQKKKKRSKERKNKIEEKQMIESETISTENNNDNHEASSDWIIEDGMTGTDQISQLTEMVRRTSTTDEDRIAKVNIILKKIRKQQVELRKLRQYVMSILGEQPKRNSKKTKLNSNISQDLLMAFLNQPMLSGCWLCSGKMYTEVATQCDHVDEQ